MNGLDIIVFTAGVGENQAGVRSDCLKGMGWMGIEIDEKINAGTRGEEIIISKPESRVKVVVIPTDEELMIARDTMALIS